MVSIIAAISENLVIGNENRLLWHIPEDMQRFKRLTLGHPVIMGRKTFASLGKPLLNRLNIVLTHTSLREWNSFAHRDIIISQSLTDAIALANKQDKEEIFIIGGGQIYAQAINLADKLYLTIVKGDFTGDTCFPDYSRFNKIVSKEERFDGRNHFSFLELMASTPGVDE